MNKYIDLSKKIANYLQINPDKNIFHFDEKLYSIDNPQIQIAHKNKRDFLDFMGEVISVLHDSKYDASNLTRMNEKKGSYVTTVVNKLALDRLKPHVQNGIIQELEKCHKIYTDLYDKPDPGPTYTTIKNTHDSMVFMREENLYSDKPGENEKIIEKQIRERHKQLKMCAEERPWDATYKLLLDKNPVPTADLSIEEYCQEVVWGTNMLQNTCGNIKTKADIESLEKGAVMALEYQIAHLPDKIRERIEIETKLSVRSKYFQQGENHDELHAETLDKNKKQYVFGYIKYLEKYTTCPEKFICITMKRPLLGSGACGEFIDWSRKLNTLYTQCAVRNENKFIRFIMPPDNYLPQKNIDQTSNIVDVSIFKNIPVAVLIIKFTDNRFKETKSDELDDWTVVQKKRGKKIQQRPPNVRTPEKRRHVTELLILHIFYDIDAEIRYNTYELGMSRVVPSRLVLYNDYKRQIMLGQILKSTLVTYNEFEIMAIYNKSLIKDIYRSIEFPHILFLTSHEFDEQTIQNMGLTKADIVTHIYRDRYNRLVTATFIVNVTEQQFTGKYRSALEAGRLFAYSIRNKKFFEEVSTNYVVSNNLITQDDLNVFGINKAISFSTNRPKRPRSPVELNYLNLKKIRVHKSTMVGGSNISFSPKLDLRQRNEKTLDGFVDPHLIDMDTFINYNKLINYDRLKICMTGIITDFDKQFHTIFKLYDPHVLVEDVDVQYLTLDYDVKKENKYGKTNMQWISTSKVAQWKSKRNHITIYRPRTSKFFNQYELLENFQLITANTKSVGIFGFGFFSAVEAIHYYTYQHGFDYIKSKLYYDPKITMAYSSEKVHKIVTGLQTHMDFDFVPVADLLDNPTQDLDKFDVIFDDYVLNPVCKNMSYDLYFLNSMKFAAVLFTLKNLNVGGDFVFAIRAILIKSSCDLVLILSQYFETYELYNFEIQAKYKLISCAVVFKKFKGIDPTALTNLEKLYDEIKENQPPLSKPDFDVPSEYIAGYIDSDSRNEIYDKFRYFNTRIFTEKCHHLQMSKDAMSDPSILIRLEKQAIYESFKYARQYGFEIIDNVGIEHSDNFVVEMYKDSFFQTESTYYQFIKDAVNVPSIPYINLHMYVKLNPIENLDYDKRRVVLLERAIDTRDLNKWDRNKEVVRYYRPAKILNADLREYVQKTYTTGQISQAWLKMYEIVAAIPELVPETDILRTFHICEAPGSFISALNHYVKTHTGVKEFIWKSQSLKPKSIKGDNKKTAFGDDYGYISRHPKNWDFGSDGTGNILNKANIEHYIKINQTHQPVLITSDCGIPWSEDSSKQNELLKLHFAEMLLILEIAANTKPGSNFVAKFFFPIASNLELDILYTLHTSFEKLIFYKPQLNIFSKEFYIVGIKFSSISNTVLKSMRKVYDQDTINIDDKFLDTNVPENFLNQLMAINNHMVRNYIFNFKKQVFYVDHHEELGPKFIEFMKHNAQRKNKEWCEKHKLKSISRTALL